MPRKNPLPAQELAIGQRVRIVRENRGHSRASFARFLEEDGSTIANIEHGRAPLRFGLAHRLCTRFGINERWLATGRLPMNFRPLPFYGFLNQLPARTPYRKAYPQLFAALMEKALTAAAKKARCTVEELDDRATARHGLEAAAPESPEMIATRERALGEWAAGMLHTLPPELHQPFLDEMKRVSESFLAKHQRAITKHRLSAPTAETP